MISQQFSEGEIVGDKGFTYGREARFINYNKDSYPDVLAYPFVHVNDGNGQRRESIQFAEAQKLETLNVGDFNRDGLDDVVALYENGEIKIFMNSRKGLKEHEQDAKVGYYRLKYSDIYIADINADKNPDIIINNYGKNIMAYTGNGKGQFQRFLRFEKLFGNFDFVMSKDIDGDGKQEIVSNFVNFKNGERTTSVKIRAFEKGAYIEKGTYRLKTSVDLFHIEDIDGDGDLDFIYSVRYQKGIHWNERDSNGNYNKIHTIETTENPKSFFLCDMDGDKDLDIVRNTDVPPIRPSKNYWIENIKDGIFSEEKLIMPRHENAHVMVADLNGDHIGDFVEFSTRNGFVISVGINSNMKLSYQDDWVVTGGIDDFGFMDVNNDGVKDIIAASRRRLFYYEVSKKGEISDLIPIAQSEFIFNKIILADMDNDGLVDVFWWDELTKINRVGWYKNLGNGKFESQEVNLDWARVPNANIIDFDGDNDMDIVTYELGKDKRRGFYVYLNDNGTFNTPRITVTEADHFRQLFVFDANLDGKPEIVDLSNKREYYVYSKNHQIETYKLPFIDKCNTFYRNLLKADIDNDNVGDIIIDDKNKLNWSKVNTKQKMQPLQIIEESPRIEGMVYAGDIDNDGDIDLICRTSDYVMVEAESFTDKFKLIWLENDGTGYFTSHFIGASLRNSWRIKLHDIDGDGDLDVFQPNRRWHTYGLFLYRNTEN
jgi:hypothetical protein